MEDFKKVCYNVDSLNLPKDNTVLNQEHEIWKPMKEFPNLYKVSNLGKVASYRKQLSTSIINSGYARVTLKIKGKAIARLLHRIIAEAFIENPENKREVNHIDGNRLNNMLSNLEWVTSSENKQHSRTTLGNVYNMPTKGMKLGSDSKYHNVSFDSNRGKWVAGVRYEGRNHYQKRFTTEKEAARHVNWILDKLELYDRPRNNV